MKETVLLIRAEQARAEALLKYIQKFEDIDVSVARINTETRTSTILPAITTNRHTYYGELNIGAWLTQFNK